MIHPMTWPDIIIGLLIAEGILYSLRQSLHFIVRRKQNQQVMERVERMRPAALDNYRAMQQGRSHEPLG